MNWIHTATISKTSFPYTDFYVRIFFSMGSSKCRVECLLSVFCFVFLNSHSHYPSTLGLKMLQLYMASSCLGILSASYCVLPHVATMTKPG